MNFSRVLGRSVGSASAAMLALSGLSIVNAPNAAAVDSSLNCMSFTNVTTNASFVVGGTYTILNSGSVPCSLTSTTGTAGTVTWTSSNGADTPASNPTQVSSGATLTVTAVVAGAQTLNWTGNNSNLYNFTVTAAPSPAVSSSSPSAWLQSYGREQGQGCKSGWHASWAEWALGKTGGWVCNRTVYWNGSAWRQDPNVFWILQDWASSTEWDGS